MLNIFKLFFPNKISFKSVNSEIVNTSISRERFIDFAKVLGILFLVINSHLLLSISESYGEYNIRNLSETNLSRQILTWFTTGMSLFAFTMGFNNLIAWYSNVGREGSQWQYLVDRTNSILGPLIVWIISITILLNVLYLYTDLPLYLTTSEDGIMSSIEFVLWPMWLVTIYLVLVIFAPLTIYLHRKFPHLTVVLLTLLTLLVDSYEFPLNFSYLKLLNYLFFWLLIHQLGYFFADGKFLLLKKNLIAFVFLSLLSYLFFILEQNINSLSMASYRLSNYNNEDPPTILYLAASMMSLFVLLYFKNFLEFKLNSKNIWKIVSIVHSNIYTLFFWHLIVIFFVYTNNLSIYYSPLILFLFAIIFGNYERSLFKLSTNFIKRVTPLQPWPTPIKAKFSTSNFSLAWFSVLIILLGIIHITLGGIGQNGFFTLREFYFLRSSTYEAIGRILIGVLLLNITVRGLKYKKRVMFLAVLFFVSVLYSRTLIQEEITQFEYNFYIMSSLYLLFQIISNSNYKLFQTVK